MSWSSWILGNALAATALASLVALAQPRVRLPRLLHVAWGIVLLRLVAVPAFEWRVLPSWPTAPAAQALTTPGAAAAIPPVLRAEMPLLEPFAFPAPAGPESVPAAGESRPTPAPASRLALSPAAFLAGIALLGTVALLGLAIVRAARFRRLLRAAVDAPPWLRSRADRVARELGLAHAPRLRLVPARIPPAVTAAPRPEILLPLPLLRKLPPAQLDALLAHELAHVRRGDPWLRPLELLIVALWWWHPVAWWAHRNFRAAEERACDDLVVRRRPGAARDYADAIVSAAAFLAKPRPPTPVLVSAFGVKDLKERLTMILERKPTRAPARPWIVLGVAALLVALVVAPSKRGDAATAKGDGEPPAPPASAPEPPATRVPAPAPVPDVPPPPGPPGTRNPIEERIALERQIRELEIRQMELRNRAEGLDAEAHARQMHLQLVELERQGRTEDAARLAEEVAKHEAEAARQRTRMDAEAQHVAMRMKTEMQLRELELRLQAMQEVVAPEKIEALEKEVESTRRKMEELEVQAMREELRRMTEELDARAAELDRAKSRAK